MIRDLNGPEAAAIDEVVLAIHGILAPATSPTWPERLANCWAARPGARRFVITSRYYETPTPRLAWLRNRGRTKRLLGILEHLAAQLSRHGSMPPTRLHLVGHSNGGLLALQLALTIAAKRNSPWRLGTLALISPALPAGPATRKVASLIEGRRLGKAVLYRAANDRALGLTDLAGGLLAWPWGSLGRHGWALDHAMSPMRGMETRDFRRGHSGYFARRGREQEWEDLAAEQATFALLECDFEAGVPRLMRKQSDRLPTADAARGDTAAGVGEAPAAQSESTPLPPFPL